MRRNNADTGEGQYQSMFINPLTCVMPLACMLVELNAAWMDPIHSLSVTIAGTLS